MPAQPDLLQLIRMFGPISGAELLARLRAERRISADFRAICARNDADAVRLRAFA